MPNASITNWIAERASRLGFAMCGIVRAKNFPELLRQEEWLARGYAGQMKYLNDARRSDLQTTLPGVRSVIVGALTYNTPHPRAAEARADIATSAPETEQEPRGWISRYAWGDDYHGVMRTKLEALLAELHEQNAEPFEARIYSDTGPINERVLAKHAGLGWLGKNTLLLNEQLGSFFFLGVILTTLDLQPEVDYAGAPPADRCGTCCRCIDACPTSALEPYVLDARKCISYLTIELRGTIPHEFRAAMGPHIFGCDICQDVCPWNRNAPMTHTHEFQPRTCGGPVSEMCETPRAFPGTQVETPSAGELPSSPQESLFLPKLEWLASLDEEEFREMFRGSPVKRTKWKGLIRNACIALGNSQPAGHSKTFERVSKLLSRLAASDEPVISESAQWAIARIQENESGIVNP